MHNLRLRLASTICKMASATVKTNTVIATQPNTVIATQPNTVIATQPNTVIATQPNTVIATQPNTTGDHRSGLLFYEQCNY